MFKKLALVALSVAAIAVSGVQAGGHSKARNKTVIFDIDGGKVAQPYNFNNLVPGTTRSNGFTKRSLNHYSYSIMKLVKLTLGWVKVLLQTVHLMFGH